MSGVIDGFERRPYDIEEGIQCHNVPVGLVLKSGKEQIIMAAKEAELNRITLMIQNAYQEGKVSIEVRTGLPDFVIEKLEKMDFNDIISKTTLGRVKNLIIKL